MDDSGDESEESRRNSYVRTSTESLGRRRSAMYRRGSNMSECVKGVVVLVHVELTVFRASFITDVEMAHDEVRIQRSALP